MEKKILEGSLLPINQEAIDRILAELDLESRAIVTYIWQKKYATIEELASLFDASNHMDVLLRIKEVINPLAEKMIGTPLLVFEKSKIDAETGKKILFSWWIMGVERKESRRRGFVDLLDEGGYLRIIMELFGADEEDVQLKLDQNKLVISANPQERKYHEEIPLPAKVNLKGLSKKYKNEILEVRLQKA
jgi:HSP20 family molecular chaperone IbpA